MVPPPSGLDVLTDLAESMSMRGMPPSAFGAAHHHMAQDALIPRITSIGMVTVRAVYGVGQVPEEAAVPTALIGFMFIKVRDYAD